MKNGERSAVMEYSVEVSCHATNRPSSLEFAVYGTSCLLLPFLNPICHLSNLKSINLV